MKIGGIDLAERALVIAEIGANHEGDIEAARAMIREAARAGADAVKFQTYKAEGIVARTEETRFAQFQRLSLSDAAFRQLAVEARNNSVLFLSTPFDLDAVELLNPLVPAFKVASGDLTFLPLLEAIAATGKPIFLSTGMASLDEIDLALHAIQRGARVPREALRGRVVLLHCVSSYPTPPEDANLRAIGALRDRFGLSVGYSDHTLGTLACIAAVAMGACVIEKHFTLQKEGRTFRDHQLSADPADLTELTTKLRTLGLMLGRGEKVPMGAEEGNRLSMRRSLAARGAIKAGDKIALEHLTCLRPGGGIPPASLGAVVGMIAPCDIAAGHLLPTSMLTPKDAAGPHS